MTYHRQHFLFIAWLIAFLAVVVTQYATLALDFPVCTLCWYQRICIYPLAIILGIGAYQDDRRAAIYGLPLALLGVLFSGYQYLMQMIPNWSPIEFCRVDVSCSTIHLKLFGFVTFPFLGFLSCLSIVIVLWLAKRS